MKFQTKSTDVIVVGAGLSGLRTAVGVHRAGLSVLVLEARNRVGGKTLSVKASTIGGKVDLGAAWINDSNQSEMYKLARQFDFDLIEQRATGANLSQDASGNTTKYDYGTELEASQDNENTIQSFVGALLELIDVAHPEKPHLSPNAKELDSITWADFARKEGRNPRVVEWANGLSAALLGVEADEVSALFMVDYLQSGTGLVNMGSDLKNGGQYLRNRQGNQTFSLRLAALLPENSIQLLTAVSKITQQGPDCIIELVGSDITYRARRVVVSLPSSELPSITFSPPLPHAKQKLSQNTAMGYYAKAIFVYDRPWWREAGLSGSMSSEKGPICFSRDTCSEADGQYSITCFLVGNKGREWSKWSSAERRRQLIEQFDLVFGQAARQKNIAVPAPVNIFEVEWIKDPWARGAPSPVMSPGVLTSEAGKAIREQFGNVHFVGTETALVWKGYMEGAVRSGIRGAQEVIDALQPRTRAKLS